MLRLYIISSLTVIVYGLVPSWRTLPSVSTILTSSLFESDIRAKKLLESFIVKVFNSESPATSQCDFSSIVRLACPSVFAPFAALSSRTICPV